jgi:GTP-binding protein HflX
MTKEQGTVEVESRRDLRAVLVGVELKGHAGTWGAQDSLAELGRLASTAGLTVAGVTYQKLARPIAGTWIGSGKVREVKEIAAADDAGVVLFDEELSPGQQKKLEKSLGAGIRIIDRTRLILDIFSRRAHSKEGQLQVELAQYQYLLPRLSGLRTDLEQQVGGAGAGLVGLRGPGETQLEMDRRRVRRSIQKLKKDIAEIKINREERRKRRNRFGLPVVSIVGYTNAGKSSLLNALTGAGVLVEDKLFATLDPTTRRLRLPGGREALLTDTVGFIRKLPHDLVAAFRATLEDVQEASLILHVVDSSHPRTPDQITAVETVLTGLEVIHTPRLLVWNKIDLTGPNGSGPLPPPHHEWEPVSAKTGRNLDALLARVEKMLSHDLVTLEVLIPYDKYDLITAGYELGTIERRGETEAGVRLRVSAPRNFASKLSEYVVDAATDGSGDAGDASAAVEPAPKPPAT